MYADDIQVYGATTVLCFLSPHRGLGATYDVHLRLIGKRVMDFLLMLIELFSLGVMAEALRAKIDLKSAFCKGVGELRPNFRVEGDLETKKNLVAVGFHTKKLSSSEVRFYTKKAVFGF